MEMRPYSRHRGSGGEIARIGDIAELLFVAYDLVGCKGLGT